MNETLSQPTFLDQSIMEWFYDNKQLSKYIEISSIHDQTDNESTLQTMAQMEMNKQKQIIRLSQFYNTVLSTVYEETQQRPQFVNPSSSLTFMNSHKLFYAQQKMKKIKKDSVENSMKLTNRLLKLIKDPQISLQKVDIIFDETNFFREMLLDPPNYQRLETYSLRLKNHIRNDSQSDFKRELIDLLNSASVQVDKTSFYFRENHLQEQFDRIFLNRSFSLFEEIETFCNAFAQIPRSLFTKKVISIFQLLVNYLDQRLDQLSKFMLLYFCFSFFVFICIFKKS